MRREEFIRAFAVLLISAVALGQSVQLVDPARANLPKDQSAAKLARQADLLPSSFATWQRKDLRKGGDPSQFGAAYPAVLKEYGFTDCAQAVYRSGDHTINVLASRFADAGGAYGAFHFARKPEDKPLPVGRDAFLRDNVLLFYRGNVMVEVDFGKFPPPPMADMTALAEALPSATGAARNLPSLLEYLPKQPLQDVRYLVGPVGAAIDKLPLTPAEVRWDDGAEVVWARHAFPSGNADLVLISYPTPQMAAARLRDLQTAMVKDPEPGITRVARRSGPIVVWVSGAIAPAQARSLAGAVTYDASVTWNEPNFLSKRENVGNLIVAALALAGIVLLISLVAGVAFGGFRILMKHLYPDKVFDRSQDVEIIRLHLTE